MNHSDGLVEGFIKVRRWHFWRSACFQEPHVEKELESVSADLKEGPFRLAIELCKLFELSSLGLDCVVAGWHLSSAVEMEVGH